MEQDNTGLVTTSGISRVKDKNKTDDRIFVLKPIEGKFTMTTASTVDHRLYKGGNNIHARIGPTSLWTLYLDHGALPPSLKQSFTSFGKCEKAVRDYYIKRNIEVTKILD